MYKEKKINSTFSVHPLIEKRWSSRSFDKSKEIKKETMSQLIEAARWAPSSYNDQPWRFLIANRSEPAFNLITKSLFEFNQMWAPDASSYIVVVGNTKRDDGTPNYAYSYDCGQAVAFLSLEATNCDIMLHQMGGFDKKQLHEAFELQSDLDVLVVIAAGYYGENPDLHENIKGLESTPRERKSQEEILL